MPSRSQLRDVTCHMGGITQTSYLPPDTSERAPLIIPASKSVLDLHTPEGWKAKLT